MSNIKISQLFILLALLFGQYGCFKSRDPLQLCSSDSCNYAVVLPGMISVSEGEEQMKYFLLTGKGLKESKINSGSGVPFAYDFKKNIAALKKSDIEGFSINIFDVENKKNIAETVLPETVSSVFSGCFMKNGSLAMLILEENENLSRRYFLSISESSDINEWRSYLIREEAAADFLGSMLSLGSSFERPVSVQCSGENIFIHTLTTFSDMIQANVYRFDIEKMSLIYETGYHPFGVKDGVISIYFNEKNSTGYVHQKRELVILKGADFPVKTKFEESGEVFFSPVSDNGGLIIYFIPQTNSRAAARARIMKFD